MNKAPYLGLFFLFSGFQASVSLADSERSLVQNRGSDSMAIAVINWSEAYKGITRKAGISVSGGGTGTGIAALINGSVNIANASRRMTEKEKERAIKRGVNPVEHKVGLDAIAIYLHPDNPIVSLSKSQLKGIFSGEGEIERWTDLGVEVPGCKDQKIVRASRQSSSGTHMYLRENLFEGEKYKLGTLEMQGSKDVVAMVAMTPCAVGYSSYAYAIPEVKLACIELDTGDRCINPSVSAVTDRSYPLSRPLFMYTNGEPDGHIKDYIGWILSDQGQCILLQRQYAPIRRVTCGE